MNRFDDEMYYYNNQYYPMNPREKTKVNIKKTIHIASRTIYTINQLIPIINQVVPLVNNARNAIKVVKLVNSINEQDLHDIEESISDNDKTDDIQFENMIQ